MAVLRLVAARGVHEVARLPVVALARALAERAEGVRGGVAYVRLHESGDEGRVAREGGGVDHGLVEVRSHALVVGTDERVVLINRGSVHREEAQEAASVSRGIVKALAAYIQTLILK